MGDTRLEVKLIPTFRDLIRLVREDRSVNDGVFTQGFQAMIVYHSLLGPSCEGNLSIHPFCMRPRRALRVYTMHCLRGQAKARP